MHVQHIIIESFPMLGINSNNFSGIWVLLLWEKSALIYFKQMFKRYLMQRTIFTSSLYNLWLFHLGVYYILRGS